MAITRQKLAREIGKRVLALGVIGVLVWLAFPLLEAKIIYWPDLDTEGHRPMEFLKLLAPAMVPRIQDVYFESLDGTRLNAWYTPPKPGMPVVIYAHGNGGDMGTRGGMVREFTDQGYGFFMFDYRGYGESDGVPEEQGLYKDFEAASNYVEKTYGYLRSQQIAVGESLGSAVVIDVASRMPFRQVVLLSSFTSGDDFARHNVFPVSLSLFTHQRFDSISKIGKITAPLVIAHGTADKMMPMDMPKRLYKRAGSKNKALIWVKDAGHNDAFMNGADEVFAAIEKNERLIGGKKS